MEQINAANEKLRGRALFERQQCFSRLVSGAARIGLIARRAQWLNVGNESHDLLTMQTLAEVPVEDGIWNGILDPVIFLFVFFLYSVKFIVKKKIYLDDYWSPVFETNLF